MKIISDEQVRQRLTVENPWWKDSATIPAGEYRPRAYFDLLYPLIADSSVRRAVVLLGPRRVGKTVMLYHAIKRLLEVNHADAGNVFFVSLDHPLYNGLSLDDLLAHFAAIRGIELRKERVFVFFDEIQYLRDWELHLKSIVDTYPNIRCTASGSAAAALRMKSQESGAGRFTDFLLPPLTFYEYLDLMREEKLIDSLVAGRSADGFVKGDDYVSTLNIDELNRHFLDYVNFGGYPEVIFSEEAKRDPGRFIKSDIIDKVLLRDLPSLYGIQDIQELNSLFTMLAFNTGQEVSLDDLSMNSGVSKNTIKKYIEYLEAAFLIKIVHRIDRNARRFKRAHAFKVYLTNPSMRAALFSPITEDNEFMGALAETAIFSQWFHQDIPLYYARWKKGEVDIVHMDAGRPTWAVEIKWTDRLTRHPGELRGLIDFCKEHGFLQVLVTTRAAEGMMRHEGIAIEMTPTAHYCFVVGYNGIVRKNKGVSHSAPREAEVRP